MAEVLDKALAGDDFYRPLAAGLEERHQGAERLDLGRPGRRDRLPHRVAATRTEVDDCDVPEGAVAMVRARSDRPTRHPRQAVVDSPPRRSRSSSVATVGSLPSRTARKPRPPGAPAIRRARLTRCLHTRVSFEGPAPRPAFNKEAGKMASRFCTKCGTPRTGEFVYCPSCGFKFEQTSAAGPTENRSTPSGMPGPI